MHVDLGFMAYECVVMNEFCFFLENLIKRKNTYEKKRMKNIVVRISLYASMMIISAVFYLMFVIKKII